MIREIEKEIAKLTRNSESEGILKKYVEWHVKKKSVQPVFGLQEVIPKEGLDEFAQKFEPNVRGTKFLRQYLAELMFYSADFRLTDFGNSVYCHAYLQPGRRHVRNISSFLKSNLDIEPVIVYSQSGKVYTVKPKLPMEMPIPKVTEENAFAILNLLTRQDASDPPIRFLSYSDMRKLLDLNLLKLRKAAVNFYHNLEVEEGTELSSVGFSILPYGRTVWDTEKLAEKYPNIIRAFMKYAHEIFD